MKRAFPIIAALSLAFGGCATQTVILQDPNDQTPPTKTYRQSFFVYGIGQSQQVNAAAVCGGPDRVIRVETQQAPLDAIFGTFTLGLYAPRSTKIYCRE